jgi:hypothetical protein
MQNFAETLESEIITNSRISMNNRQKLIKRVMPQINNAKTEAVFDDILRRELSKETGITAVEIEKIIANVSQSEE